MKSVFLVYSDSEAEIHEIEEVFDGLGDVELVWVEDSVGMGRRIHPPFVAREADGFKLIGLRDMKRFAERVRGGVSAAAF